MLTKRRKQVMATQAVVAASPSGDLLLQPQQPPAVAGSSGQRAFVPSPDGPAQRDASHVVGWDRVAERCRAFGGELLCVAIGVIGLPAVNSDFSRSAGDHAIAEFHHRLELAGGDDCVVERVGGSCFLAVLTSGGSDRLVVQRFLNVARRPIAGPHGVVVLGCAAGVSVGHSRRPLVLIDRAVRNLDAALERGAGSSEWVDSSPRLKPTPVDLAAPLLAAVQRGEIVAAFQPVVSLLAGDIIEFEALARWPGHDDVSPRRMVELARDIGILGEFRTCVVTLGRRVAPTAPRIGDSASGLDRRHRQRVCVARHSRRRCSQCSPPLASRRRGCRSRSPTPSRNQTWPRLHPPSKRSAA